MRRRTALLLILFVVIIADLLFLYKNIENHEIAVSNARILSESKKQAWLKLRGALENEIGHFNGKVSLEVIDLDSNNEISFNKDALVPAASLVKIPIMLSCFYAAQEGKVSLKDAIRPGSRFTAEELFKPMITQSDNGAANQLIDFMGFDTLNAYFKKMGLRNTNISRKMLDFRKRKDGEENYTTAEDMAYLLQKLYHKQFLNKDVSERCLELLGQQKINDRIPRKLPKNGTFIAHKTGLERNVCHDVGIVYTNKGNFLICVLVYHHNQTAKPAKKLISDIALLVYNYYQDLQ